MALRRAAGALRASAAMETGGGVTRAAAGPVTPPVASHFFFHDAARSTLARGLDRGLAPPLYGWEAAAAAAVGAGAAAPTAAVTGLSRFPVLA